MINYKLNCPYCHEQAVIEIGSGCKCTACGQTWGSIPTFIRERFYHQNRNDEPARATLATSTHANPKRLSEQWAETINELPLKFSTALLKLVTKLIIRLVKLFTTMAINLAILVFVTYPILIFTPLFLKIRGQKVIQQS